MCFPNARNLAMNILRLPDLGASTGEAEVVVWLKAVGETARGTTMRIAADERMLLTAQVGGNTFDGTERSKLQRRKPSWRNQLVLSQC